MLPISEFHSTEFASLSVPHEKYQSDLRHLRYHTQLLVRSLMLNPEVGHLSTNQVEVLKRFQALCVADHSMDALSYHLIIQVGPDSLEEVLTVPLELSQPKLDGP